MSSMPGCSGILSGHDPRRGNYVGKLKAGLRDCWGVLGGILDYYSTQYSGLQTLLLSGTLSPEL